MNCQIFKKVYRVRSGSVPSRRVSASVQTKGMWMWSPTQRFFKLCHLGVLWAFPIMYAQLIRSWACMIELSPTPILSPGVGGLGWNSQPSTHMVDFLATSPHSEATIPSPHQSEWFRSTDSALVIQHTEGWVTRVFRALFQGPNKYFYFILIYKDQIFIFNYGTDGKRYLMQAAIIRELAYLYWDEIKQTLRQNVARDKGHFMLLRKVGGWEEREGQKLGCLLTLIGTCLPYMNLAGPSMSRTF